MSYRLHLGMNLQCVDFRFHHIGQGLVNHTMPLQFILTDESFGSDTNGKMAGTCAGPGVANMVMTFVDDLEGLWGELLG